MGEARTAVMPQEQAEDEQQGGEDSWLENISVVIF